MPNGEVGASDRELSLHPVVYPVPAVPLPSDILAVPLVPPVKPVKPLGWLARAVKPVVPVEAGEEEEAGARPMAALDAAGMLGGGEAARDAGLVPVGRASAPAGPGRTLCSIGSTQPLDELQKVPAAAHADQRAGCRSKPAGALKT